MTHRITKARRLESAGYVYLSGWIPEDHEVAEAFADLVEMYRSTIERIAEEAPPRGRPKKEGDRDAPAAAPEEG